MRRIGFAGSGHRLLSTKVRMQAQVAAATVVAFAALPSLPRLPLPCLIFLLTSKGTVLPQPSVFDKLLQMPSVPLSQNCVPLCLATWKNAHTVRKSRSCSSFFGYVHLAADARHDCDKSRNAEAAATTGHRVYGHRSIH